MVTGGKYVGHRGTIEANVYQRTVDYPDEWANGYHGMLDTERLVTVRWGSGGSDEDVIHSSTRLLRPHKRQLLAGRRTGLRIWQPAPGRRHSTGD